MSIDLNISEASAFQKIFDVDFVNFIKSFRSEALTIIASDFTSLGSLTIVTVLFLALTVIILKSGKIKDAFFLFCVWLGCLGLPWLAKSLFARGRPGIDERLIEVHDLSFPSGHSFVAAAFFTALACVWASSFKRKSPNASYKHFIIAFVMAVLVGLSRLYLGVHYLTDVLGGLMLGASWALLLAFVFNVKEEPSYL